MEWGAEDYCFEWGLLGVEFGIRDLGFGIGDLALVGWWVIEFDFVLVECALIF